MVRPVTLSMKPYEATIDLDKTALIIIDMQEDFIKPGGFGDKLGNDVSRLEKAVGPCQKVLQAARGQQEQQQQQKDGGGGEDTTKTGLRLIIHTREGHRADLTDLHSIKHQRPGAPNTTKVIGTEGPRGRILIRGEPGHDIIPELYPQRGEPIIDKPGKGSFYATDLDAILKAQGIETLLVCGVTTEVCVHTTIREGNDRGYYCILVEDCCASYRQDYHDWSVELVSAHRGLFGSVVTSNEVLKSNDRGYYCIMLEDCCGSFFDDFHDTAVRMITAQGGIFGSVSDSTKLLAALESQGP